MSTQTIKVLGVRIIYACVTLLLLEGCQSCNRYQISPSEELNEIATKYGGIPNIGNTCYMNSGLQIIARLYPDLFSHMNNNSGRYGQAIVDKITSENRKEFVTREEAKAFFEALLASYNKHHTEQLHHGNQEDVAPVLGFLLNEGNVQRLELYSTVVNPGNPQDARNNNVANNGDVFLTVNFPVANQETSDALSIDELVTSTLTGNHVTDFCWDQDAEIRGDAIVENKLSIKNIRGLTNRILPIWVHRFAQTSNQDPDSGTTITTPITNPFKLTIAAEYFIENTAKPYTGNLVGFIRHIGGLNSGHYIAYVRNQAGKWKKYNDEIVTELHAEPLEEAQKAYLYFYQDNQKL